jgi:hypothetical protein
VRRSTVAVTGIAVAALYVASAAWSGHLSPLARRPILDGLAPPVPYRWVEPPAELAGTNDAPSPETFRVALGAGGSETAVLTTDDAQVTVILPEGAFEAGPGRRSVSVRVEPLGASAVAPPPAPTTILGNVYRITAAYRPSGEAAEIGGETRVVLVYPLVAGDHGGHEVLLSTDPGAWTALETNDLPSVQQADAPIPSLGDVAVGGTVTSVAPSPGAVDEGGWPVGVIVLVGALVVLVVAAVALLRPRRGGLD